MFDMIQNKECDIMEIEIKEELDVDFSEIYNQNFQKECDKPSTLTTVKVEKDDTWDDQNIALNHVEIKQEKLDENVEIKREDPLSISSTNIDNFDLSKLPADGSLKYVMCISCNKTLKVSSKLEKDIKCFKCSNLSKIHKTIKNDETFLESCHLCGQVFRSKNSVTKHIKTVHEGRKDYNCHLCNTDFTSESNLKSHIKNIHEGQRNYKCEKCNKDFFSLSHLKYHRETVHEGRKDFKCHICHKDFYQKSYLKLHIKLVHEGRKDYQCNECEKAFKQNGDLNRHIKAVHEGNKDFKCHLCNKAYSTKSNVRKHIKNVHTGIKNN